MNLPPKPSNEILTYTIIIIPACRPTLLWHLKIIQLDVKIVQTIFHGSLKIIVARLIINTVIIHIN